MVLVTISCLTMSLPYLTKPIITDILHLADLPIDTRLALKIKPRKLVSPFAADAELMQSHKDMQNSVTIKPYDGCRNDWIYSHNNPHLQYWEYCHDVMHYCYVRDQRWRWLFG